MKQIDRCIYLVPLNLPANIIFSRKPMNRFLSWCCLDVAEEVNGPSWEAAFRRNTCVNSIHTILIKKLPCSIWVDWYLRLCLTIPKSNLIFFFLNLYSLTLLRLLLHPSEQKLNLFPYIIFGSIYSEKKTDKDKIFNTSFKLALRLVSRRSLIRELYLININLKLHRSRSVL